MAFSFIRDMDSVINILIFVITAISFLFCFRKDGQWDLHKGKKSLRFFTILSNLFCAVSALLLVLSSSYWAWLLKYVGTVAVTVTLLTVLFFLGPHYGYKVLFSGPDLWLHLICPLLALFAWLAWDRVPIPPLLSLIGVIPVLLYGLLYLHKVVFAKAWEDFYGFNQGGKWPFSFAAMLGGAALLSLLLSLL